MQHQQYQRVFLVLRHCLRSTPNTVNFHNSNNNDDDDRPLTYAAPDWNTPTYFCTRQGLDFISELGAFLKENGFHFEKIVSDIKYRDADTSMALAVALGIDSVQYAPEIFDSNLTCPLHKDYSMDTTARVEKRFRAIPMPADLEETLEELRDKLEGNNNNNNNASITTSPNDSLFNDPHTHVVGPLQTTTTDTKPRLSGSINAIKLFAQQLFYARASGIPFHNSDFPSPMKFVPWIAYTRTILNYGTVPAAVRGTILLQHMMLQTQQQESSTIFVGHDTDIDGVSTVLELNHTLPGYGLLATPPGSGLFLGVTRGGAVQIKVLYPEFHYNNNNSFLDHHPAAAKNNTTTTTKDGVTMTMKWLSIREFRSPEDLVRRVRIRLDQEYGDEVVQCFDSLEKKMLSGRSATAAAYYNMLLLSLVLLIFGGGVFLVLYRKARRRHSPVVINPMMTASSGHPRAGEEYGVVLSDIS